MPGNKACSTVRLINRLLPPYFTQRCHRRVFISMVLGALLYCKHCWVLLAWLTLVPTTPGLKASSCLSGLGLQLWQVTCLALSPWSGHMQTRPRLSLHTPHTLVW